MPGVELKVRPSVSNAGVENKTQPAQANVRGGRSKQHQAPSFYMAEGVLYHWGTKTRKMTSSEDLSMFDKNPNRTRSLLKRFPEVTTIVQGRELFSRAEILPEERKSR